MTNKRNYKIIDDGGNAFGTGMVVGGLAITLCKQYLNWDISVEGALPIMITSGIFLDRFFNRQYISRNNRQDNLLEEKIK
jgi:hypothetical protein